MNRLLAFIGAFVPLFVLSALAPFSVFAAEASEFVLLTGNDGPLATGIEPGNLPGFLNNLYTILIGVAVVLAILQIIRGGIMWMLTDSVTEKGHASHLVTIAVMGLVLILSPVVVFNIINPKILNLDISEGLAELKKGLPVTGPGAGGGTGTSTTPLPKSDETIVLPGHSVNRGYSGTEAKATSWESEQNGSGRTAYKPETKYRCAKMGTNGCESYLTISSQKNDLEMLYLRICTLQPGELAPVESCASVPRYFLPASKDFVEGCTLDGGKVKDSSGEYEYGSGSPLHGAVDVSCGNFPQDKIDAFIVEEKQKNPDATVEAKCGKVIETFCKVNG